MNDLEEALVDILPEEAKVHAKPEWGAVYFWERGYWVPPYDEIEEELENRGVSAHIVRNGDSPRTRVEK